MTFHRNLIAMTASSVFGQVALIASGAIAARALGPTDRGHYAILMLLPLIVSQVLQLGIPIAMTYFIATDGGMGKKTLRSAAQFGVLQSVISIGVLGIIIVEGRRWIPSQLILPGLLTLPIAVFLILQQYTFAILQGLNRFSHVALARLSPAVIYAALALLLWITGTVDILSLSLAWLIANFLTAIAGLALVVHIGVPRPSQPILRDLKELLTYGSKAFIGGASPMDTLKLDQAIGGILISPSALGIYVVAQSFAGLPKFAALNAGFVIYANTAQKVAEDAHAKPKLLRYIGRLGLVSGLLTLLLILVIPTLTVAFFGERFSSAILPSQILVGAAWISSNRRFLGELGKGLGYPEILTWSELILTPLVASLAWLMCPVWNVVGLALAVALAQFAALGLGAFLLNRRLKLRPHPHSLNKMAQI